MEYLHDRCVWTPGAMHSFPRVPHQLTGGVVSLSLVFRTNNANRRVIDARQLLSKLSECTRDITLVSQYTPNEGDCSIETLRHLPAFPYAA